MTVPSERRPVPAEGGGAADPGLTAEHPLHVVATGGHVDHGKSSLILRLTGMDPDRLAEEKRRGLTIDLGFAWTVLPSGREVGFVDVPGHERFIRNMLAGVGPVRLVLFVVAADEGWKPQSEEHLQILDLLGVEGAVIALTKRDVVDTATLERRASEVERRIEGTGMQGAAIVPVDSVTGRGVEAVRAALDAVLAAAPAPQRDGRARQFVDRIFTIRGAGTVVTGTLTGGSIAVGQEAEILPSGHRARIRGLQTHKRTLPVARPVSRVAVNLAGTAKVDLERGDALTIAGQWRGTRMLEGWIRPVRGLAHPITGRGAYKLHVGAAERDANLHLYGRRELRQGERAFARLTLTRPAVLDLCDPFILRDAGRNETVAGGVVLDPDPPARPGPDPEARLLARLDADRPALAERTVADRGAIRAADLRSMAGVEPEVVVGRGMVRLGAWLLHPDLYRGIADGLQDILRRFHSEHPLRPGMEATEARFRLAEMDRVFEDAALADAVLEHLDRERAITRQGAIVKLPDHSIQTRGRGDADRLVAAVASAEPAPPSVKDLTRAGFAMELILAACAEGRLVRVSSDLVVTPDLLSRAEGAVRALAGPGPPGITVSSFREALGTSRKYALPLLEYFDREGITRRRGDYRTLQEGR